MRIRRSSPRTAFIAAICLSIAYKALVAYTSSAKHGARGRDAPGSILRTAYSGPDAQLTVKGSLPALKGDSELSRALEEALKRVVAEAGHQVDKHVDKVLAKQMQGVPGTAIETKQEAARLQKYLDCVSGEGHWQRDELGESLRASTGGVTVHKQSGAFAACDKRFYRDHAPGSRPGWDVRDDLKWTWKPNSKCNAHLPSTLLDTWQASPDQIADLPSRRSLCQLLRHKNVLLVGDAATHYLVHDLLLDWTSDSPLTCYGDLFCNEHGICGGSLSEGAKGADGWEHDETVNDRLPSPPGERKEGLLLKSQYQQPKEAGDKTYGTILRYRRSDGFYLRTSPSMPGHDAQFAHPATHVREINNYALADARRSDIALIYKAPLPLPLAASYYGNWTTTIDSAPTISAKALVALQASVAMTLGTWLPDLLDSLVQLREPPSPADLLVIYRSGWRHAPHCATAHADSSAPRLFSSTVEDMLAGMGDEVHVMLHDFQTILQNHLLRRAVLPRFGIPYLDLETPLAVWGSGFVLGSGTKNCLQTCLPSAGLALERALVGGLWKVLAWGFAKDEESLARWTGKAYVPLRVRHRGVKSR